MQSEITVRKMELIDIPDVFQIEQQNYCDPWTKNIFQRCLEVGYHAFVLEKEQKIIGYALASMVLDECHILNISIDPRLQRQGNGVSLLDFLLEYAENQGVNKVYLEVRQSNKAAIGLYKRFGFEKIGIRKQYYQTQTGSEDAILLQLTFPIARENGLKGERDHDNTV